VSDIDGSTPRAQEKIGLVMVSRRKLMGILSGFGLARFFESSCAHFIGKREGNGDVLRRK
jgi:hypothetical protein